MDDKELKPEELDKVSGGFDEGGGTVCVGGVVGTDTGTVRNCYNTGSVSGRNDSGTAVNCYNT